MFTISRRLVLLSNLRSVTGATLLFSLAASSIEQGFPAMQEEKRQVDPGALLCLVTHSSNEYRRDPGASGLIMTQVAP